MQEIQTTDTEPCPACGEPVDATVTMMEAHLTLECDEATDFVRDSADNSEVDQHE